MFWWLQKRQIIIIHGTMASWFLNSTNMSMYLSPARDHLICGTNQGHPNKDDNIGIRATVTFGTSHCIQRNRAWGKWLLVRKITWLWGIQFRTSTGQYVNWCWSKRFRHLVSLAYKELTRSFYHSHFGLVFKGVNTVAWTYLATWWNDISRCI